MDASPSVDTMSAAFEVKPRVCFSSSSSVETLSIFSMRHTSVRFVEVFIERTSLCSSFPFMVSPKMYLNFIPFVGTFRSPMSSRLVVSYSKAIPMPR